MRRFVLDGRRIRTFDEFFDEVSRVLIPGRTWGRNLDAFDDILRGGFGTPEEGFVLVIESAQQLRTALGHAATADRWRSLLTEGVVHPTNRDRVDERISEAEAGRGPTLFDELVEIIRKHGPGGDEADGNVLLELVM
jgi:RNAse (barnase) inhibitor barstar